jgi:hypothetical protein
MAAATALDDAAAAAAAVTPDLASVVDLDSNSDDDFFSADDVRRDLDDVFDDLAAAADEFCDAYSAFVASADANKRVGGGGGWLAGLSPLSGASCCCGGEGSLLEGSPDSVVTTDGGGLLAGEEAVSAVVAELERYLMEDDDGDGGDVEGVLCRAADGDGDRVAVEEHICVDDFFGDLLLSGSDFNNAGIVTAAAGALPREGVEDNDDGGGGDGRVVEEHICVDDFFGDLPAGSSDFDNGVVGTASSSSGAGALRDGVEDSDDGGDVLAAREDEPASRKRARYG